MIDSSSLQRYSLFGGLLTEQIDSIVPLMEQESYRPGDDIIIEGKTNDKIRFIAEGSVTVTRSGMLIWELGEGSTVGEMEVLDVMPSAATVQAKTAVTVLSMSNQALREIYKNDIKSFTLLLMNLARDLSRRLRIVDEMLVKKNEAERTPH